MTTTPSAAAGAPSRSTADGHRAHLDGIRALAVVAVIAYHLGYGWIPSGFVGVDVFFVLSGYLITGLLLAEAAASGTVGLGRFYARRARRLLPASLVVLLAVALGARRLVDAVAQATIGTDVTWAALYAANWRLITHEVDYFTPGEVLPSPVQHFWSLAVEEQFYLVWPLVFLGLWRLSTRRRGPEATGVLLGAIALLGVASAALSLVHAGTPFGYFATHVRAYQLLAGAALAVAARRVAHRLPSGPMARRAGVAAAVASLGVLAHMAATPDLAVGYPGPDALVVTLASVVLLVAVDLLPAGAAARALGLDAVAGVGRLSYSLYLWHWPVIVYAPVLADRWDRPWVGGRPAMIVATAVLSAGCYVLVERPVRFRLAPGAPQPVVVGLGLAMSVLVAALAVPLLRPSTPFAEVALAAAEDSAPPGDCPYLREQWGAPSRSEPCVYRRGGPITLALVGDSHAQQWQPAIDRIAAEHDLTVVRITRRGCPANDLTVQYHDDQGIVRTDVPCSIWRERVYAATIERFDPEIVFVGTRSHDWAFRHGERMVEPGDAEHVALWEDAWGPSLDVLTSGTGRVVVAETLPSIPFRVPACLVEEGSDTTACDVPLADDTGVVAYNAALRRATDRADVSLVDLSPVVCPDGTCPAMIDGEIVHRDDDHLTASFAAASAEPFEAVLRSAGVDLGRS